MSLVGASAARASRGRVRLAAAATAALAMLGASAAFADSSESINWAGYAAHRSSVSFTKVVGEWTQPRATCSAGVPTYSSIWVGIGGYSTSSPALEQIGTELDCTAAGSAVSSAWYELVPAGSRTTRLTVNPGDRLRASVRVSGRQVRLAIDDLTRHRSFTKSVRASVIDDTSAEWIVEAPSLCSSGGSCQTLPLADFGSTAFSFAGAESTTGHNGSIADRRWTTTRISLAEGGREFIGAGASARPGVRAVPSGLSAKGSAFTVAYSGSASVAATASTARVAAGRIVHAVADARGR